MTSPRIIGLDQGTTSTRALVLEPGMPPRIVHAVRHQQSFPQPGWVEHDPLELLANLRACLDAAGEAEAIGLANQGESCLAWDKVTKQPLSPVIVWQDNRTAGMVAALTAAGALTETLARAGLPLDPYFSASKLAWLMTELPEVKTAHRAGRLCLGTTDAFFLHHLTDRFVTDVTTASRTSLMNLETGDWDPVLCDLFGVPMDCLPAIQDSAGDFGRVAQGPIRASLVDQQAALYGHGCRVPGDAKITFGTGAFALAVTGQTIVKRPERGLLPTAAWRLAGQTTYAVDGGVYDAGAAVEWARQLGLFADFDELSAFDAPPAIARGLAFVPALSGLACPYWDRSAGAVWIGMTGGTTRRDMVQAVLEGVALRAAEVIREIDRQLPIAGAIRIDGGVARSNYFSQFLADVLNRDVLRMDFDELTALGCATLACPRDITKPFVLRDSGRLFAPQTGEGSGWTSLFADAVSRSQGWRR
ncbi:glycerol kinase [Acidisoma cellulosilytica]|uniref:ATP:glycerol 3-phosphotransferase n=1 Tax=Acidisoma cellulosilyticum TaxID=2802395 RepID=A0A963Z2Q0_9PROT|nr:FGGY family carbohydrate kinase [Acidisoma cellulosilyticum]MCB8881758.1 glycerol kinase [Acidisoma cellulosilyticum]